MSGAAVSERRRIQEFVKMETTGQKYEHYADCRRIMSVK
jgi:hypothetical protein